MAGIHNGVSWRNRSEEYRAGMLRKARNAGMKSMYDDGITNHELSQRQDFITACEKANVKPTSRQASKYRRQMGAAYNNGRT